VISFFPQLALNAGALRPAVAPHEALGDDSEMESTPSLPTDVVIETSPAISEHETTKTRGPAQNPIATRGLGPAMKSLDADDPVAFQIEAPKSLPPFAARSVARPTFEELSPTLTASDSAVVGLPSGPLADPPPPFIEGAEIVRKQDGDSEPVHAEKDVYFAEALQRVMNWIGNNDPTNGAGSEQPATTTVARPSRALVAPIEPVSKRPNPVSVPVERENTPGRIPRAPSTPEPDLRPTRMPASSPDPVEESVALSIGSIQVTVEVAAPVTKPSPPLTQANPIQPPRIPVNLRRYGLLPD
jgi:hypothetical protein